MTVDRGKKHKFVGMDFELIDDETLKILMVQYLEECIDSFGEDIKNTIGSPCGHDLFSVDVDSDKLDADRFEIFRHIVYNLLFVAKRARLNIDLTLSFLCT